MFGAHFYFWAGFGTDELIQHASCVAQLGLSTRTVCVRELLLLLRPTPQFDKFDRALDHPPYVVPPTETYMKQFQREGSCVASCRVRANLDEGDSSGPFPNLDDEDSSGPFRKLDEGN